MRRANLPLSLLLTLLVHLLVVMLLFWQSGFPRRMLPQESVQVIEARVVTTDPAEIRRAAAETERRRLQEQQQRQQALQRQRAEAQRQREAEQQRQRAAEQARQAELQRQREAEQARQAEQQRQREQQERETAERALQLQRQQEAEARQQREAELQRQQEEAIRQQVEAQRQAEAQRQREQEAAARRAEQERQDGIARGTMTDVIRTLVSDHWTRPPGIHDQLRVVLQLQLLGSGELQSVDIIESSGDLAYDRSAVQAVRLAAPFPLLQLEPRMRDEFRSIEMIFTPEDLTQ